MVMMIFLLANSPHAVAANGSSYARHGCDALLHPFVYNLTASYADQRNEATMVFTSVVMFMLAALFFNLNLFSRLSDVSAILNPTVRLFLSSSLSLFLPVMSYLFSEAKNEGAAVAAAAASSYRQPGGTELSLRARTILMWMLLVELLRRKVEAILVSVGAQAAASYSSTIDRASRIAWLGYLVFYNLSSTGKKAIYGTLWVLAAAKLLQRVAINELLKRSAAYGKNADQLSWYMAQIERQGRAAGEEEEGAELLSKCRYAVMGEEELEMKVSPMEGYHLELKNDDGIVVTVGDIWSQDMTGLLRHDPSLPKRLCLSFALYKLLRRRLEDHPITGEETRSCRRLIFRGLRMELLRQTSSSSSSEQRSPAVAAALFQVFYEEIQFLCEYYHSVLPVVLSNPFFFLANYILFPAVVWAFCLLTFVLCGNGDVAYAYRSITADNYIISTGTLKVLGCLLRGVARYPAVLFTAVDLAVTMLLLLTFLYEQVWELLVFVLSNWLMVSLLCEYAAKRRWRDSRVRAGLIRRILWVRSKMSRPNLCFKQASVLGFGRRLLPSMALRLPKKKAVPIQVKESIMGYLVAHINGDPDAAPLSNGWTTLRLEKHSQFRPHELWKACESKSVAEVVLTWHIATSLLEVKYPLQPEETTKKKKTPAGARRAVATALSGYAAYLMSSAPELLPDSTEGANRVYNDMKDELKEVLGGCWGYHASRQATRFDKLVGVAQAAGPPEEEETTAAVVRKGANLGKKLMEMAGEGRGQQDQVWELLAELWTELTVYLAPSAGELHVKAHKEALALGGEFITVLWALCTHTGVTRPAVAPWETTPPPADRSPV
ncbi:uncharacterized protein LOC120696959 [Panicum virgatum]|uniref:DUF4220 domain-containing protein n=1 Tax=Panicum virgatum TaxID=38727 RepID=A0A8T0UFT1_PANVG|nr:uncharacterized protein LOC120696959 [Panicum virgatum]KAG2623512.1 hypothetical protein PVAP13_3KG064527 [Panicum virgatum]